MSVEVMTWVWKHSQSEGNDRLVLLAIADHAGDDGNDAYPAVKTLASKCRLSPRTVQRAIRKLVGIGELDVELQKGGTTETRDDRRPNRYRVVMHGASDWHPVRGDGVTDEAERGDKPGTDGVSLVSPKPPLEPSKNHPSRDLNARFDDFWAVYPRRVAKKAALKAWRAAMKSGANPDVVIAAAEQYRDKPGRDLQFTAYPATWLNQGRYDDSEDDSGVAHGACADCGQVVVGGDEKCKSCARYRSAYFDETGGRAGWKITDGWGNELDRIPDPVEVSA